MGSPVSMVVVADLVMEDVEDREHLKSITLPLYFGRGMWTISVQHLEKVTSTSGSVPFSLFMVLLVSLINHDFNRSGACSLQHVLQARMYCM